MNAEQERLLMEQEEANGRRQPAGGAGQPADAGRSPGQRRPRWRIAAPWLLACLGGGGLLIAAVLAWGYWQFGSLANTLAYLNGERLLVDPAALSFGNARRGEERDLHLTIRNHTGKQVNLRGARITCGCMEVVAKYPLAIADGGQQDLTIRVALVVNDTVFEKRIDFYTDDVSNPVIAVTIRGTITD